MRALGRIGATVHSPLLNLLTLQSCMHCAQCGTRIKWAAAFISAHRMAERCLGTGTIVQVDIPYCPQCEETPLCERVLPCPRRAGRSVTTGGLILRCENRNSGCKLRLSNSEQLFFPDCAIIGIRSRSRHKVHPQVKLHSLASDQAAFGPF